MKQFKLIVFDWDGTLFDSTAHIVYAIQRSAVDAGASCPSSQRAAYVIGLGLQEAFEYVAPNLTVSQYAIMKERYRHHYLAKQKELNLFAGTLPMLQDLQQKGYLLAIATGKSRVGLNSVLEQTQLSGLFSTTRTADETASKPNPLMLYEILEELQVPPHCALMVGDTTHDLLLAQNASIASVAVNFGAHAHDELAAYNPLTICHTTRELHQWLSTHA